MTNECTRCKGTGFFRSSAGVMHYGVPGLCWGCDGGGTKAAQNAKKQIAKEAALAEVAYRAVLLDEQKTEAAAIYDACEMGFISERKRNRLIERCITECRSVGISREEFATHVVTDDIAVILARWKYDPESKVSA